MKYPSLLNACGGEVGCLVSGRGGGDCIQVDFDQSGASIHTLLSGYPGVRELN